MRHQSWSNTSVTPGQAARSAWNSRETTDRELATLPEAIAILEADLEAHIAFNRTVPALEASRRLGNARAALAAAHARKAWLEGRA